MIYVATLIQNTSNIKQIINACGINRPIYRLFKGPTCAQDFLLLSIVTLDGPCWVLVSGGLSWCCVKKCPDINVRYDVLRLI